ncbi:MAG: tetratricopeptide repeat protein [Deltaproteobacteria bacterium]|nr:tetratricopeptide repeat protein [Deltaproteobacteria bacterium]
MRVKGIFYQPAHAFNSLGCVLSLFVLSTLLFFSGPVSADSPADKSEADSPKIPVRLILVKEVKLAEAITAQLARGAVFAALAKQHSIHSTASKYGHLGRIAVTDVRPEYREAIRRLKPGEYSQPVQTQGGYAILYHIDEKNFMKGIQLFEAKEYQKAAQAFTSDLKGNPGHIEAYHYLGLSFEELGHFEKAAKAFQDLIAVDPKRANAHNNLGNALYKLKKYDAAIEAYSQALILSPNDAVIMNNLAWVLAKRNRSLDIARKLMDRALALRPNDPEYWDTLAEVHLALGERKEALAKIDKAIALGGRAAYLQKRREGIAALTARGEKVRQPVSKTKAEKPAPFKTRLASEDLKTVTEQDLSAKKEYYAVQIGAFRSRESAEKLKEKFGRQGFKAFIDHRNIPNKGSLYRVRLGPYDSMARATEAAGKVKKRYNMDYFITHETP